MIGNFAKLCLMLCLFGMVQASGIEDFYESTNNTNKESQIEKCYLSSENIEILNDQILYCLGDTVIPLTQLLCDESGLYTLINEERLGVKLMLCKKCKEFVPAAFRCINCGWAPGDPL